MNAGTRRPDHWIVRMNRVNRTWSFALSFVAIGSHLAWRGDGMLAWVLLALQFVVYPQLAYLRARRAPRPGKAEVDNLVVDSLLFGAWVAALDFPLWIGFMLFVGTTVNLTVFRGVHGLAQALAAIGAGIASVAVVKGLQFAPHTEWPTTALSAACLSLYLLVFAQGAYRRSLCLHEAREKLREGEQAMQTANQRLRRQLDEIHALQTQLREQANRDPLTGLYNRRFFDTVVERELARSAREGQSLALMLIDIDHFKQINDTHGHLAGDRVLGRLAAVLGEHSRATDVVCRIGGEEFVMLMPDMPPARALERAELIRRTVASPCCALDDESQQVTVSIGIASFPEHGRCAQQLMRHADLALYRAKNEGRDRTVSFAPRLAVQAE